MNIAAGLRRLSPVSLMGPILVGKSSPTASLYFENACADWLQTGRVQKIAPTVFASATTQLIFRHDAGVAFGFTRPKTVYFMDDYWHPDRGGAWKYQLKSKLVEQRAARYFMPRADFIGVSSDILLQMARHEFPKRNVGLVHPYWREPLAELDHFDQPGLEICYLGARSHANDLPIIMPAIRAVLQRIPNARFTISAQHSLPEDLKNHPRVNQLPTLGWQEYRHEIVKHRFHIALYPMQANAFNAARSINKLIEHAVTGAATLCPDHWQSGSNRVISIAGDSAEWRDKLLEIAGQKQFLRQIAETNKAAILRENLRETQRSIWEKLLFPK